VALLAHLAVAPTLCAAGTYSDLISSHGPVAYWRLGESSGNTAEDETGSHDGTYQNSYSLGQSGALSGDSDTSAGFSGGSNDRVQVGSFNVTGSGITLLAWFRADSFGDVRFISKATSTSPSDHTWMLGIDNNTTLECRLKIDGTTRQVSASVSTLSAGSWYFAAATYDGSTIRVYLNGTEVGTGSYSGSISTSSAAVGLANQPSGAGDRGFDGRLDEVAVFDKALSGAEISGLYSAALGSDGLLARWQFNDGTGTTVTDSVGDNNGEILGTADWRSKCGGDAYLELSGSSAYVRVAEDAALNPSGDATIAGWFKLNEDFDADSAVSQVICEKFTSNAGNLHLVLTGDDYDKSSVPGGSLVFKINGQSGAYRYTWTTRRDWKKDTWYHFAVTIDVDSPANNKVYVDGLDDTGGSDGTTQYNDMSFSAPFHMGGRETENTPGLRYLDGSVDDFRLYGMQLSATAISDLHGLLLWWKLDESAGTTAVDSTVNSRDGTLYGDPTWSPSGGKTDGALEFDGSGDELEDSDAGAFLNGLSEVTVMVWVKSDVTNQDRGIFFTANPNGGDNRLGMRYDKDGWGGGGTNLIKCSISTTAGKSAIESSNHSQSSDWQHLALVWRSGEKLQLYINGELDTPTDDDDPLGGTINNVDKLLVGVGTKNKNWDGLIDDFRIYNRAFCPDDIQAVYSGGSSPQGVRIIKWVEIR